MIRWALSLFALLPMLLPQGVCCCHCRADSPAPEIIAEDMHDEAENCCCHHHAKQALPSAGFDLGKPTPKPVDHAPCCPVLKSATPIIGFKPVQSHFTQLMLAVDLPLAGLQPVPVGSEKSHAGHLSERPPLYLTLRTLLL